jgi:hypothetical protein
VVTLELRVGREWVGDIKARQQDEGILAPAQ